MAIFITGASGLIGGSVAYGFLKAGYALRGLARTEETASALRKLGVEPVLGSLKDADLLTREALRAEAVIHTAKAEDMSSASALLDGLRGSGKTYIQTSGTGMVASEGDGNMLSSVIYDEDSEFVIAPARQARHSIDLSVRKAAQSNIRTIIICPPSIYGHGRGLKKHSSQVPFLMQRARERGAVTIIGQGLNVWSQVHVDDLVELYLMAYSSAPAGSFYFGSNGEASFREIAQALESRLHLGPIRSITIEEAERLWGESRARFVFGGNSRVIAKRAHDELGWRPQHTSVTDWISHQMDL